MCLSVYYVDTTMFVYILIYVNIV